MRTTLDIDERALSIVRSLADQKQISLGKAASLLIEKGVGLSKTLQASNFPMLPLSNVKHVITSDLVKAHIDDSY